METNDKIVLDWAIALCEQAVAEKNEGNTSLLSRIGGNGGLQTFFANAYSIHSVQYNQFSKQFPSQWKEIAGLYEAYQAEQLAEAAQVEKVESIEARIGKLESLLTDFIESQKAAVAPVAKKPVKKAAKEAAPVVETETDETSDGVVSTDEE